MIRTKCLTGCCWLAVCTLVFFQSCTQKSSKSDQAKVASESRNYFTSKSEIHYAKGFQLRYYDHYKVVTILNPFEKKGDKVEYLLLQRGTPPPKGFDPERTIEIPIRSLVAMSSMHVGLLEFINEQQVLVGMSNLNYVFSPELLKSIAAGKVQEVGKDQGMNEEKIVELHPDLVMTTGSSVSKMERYATLSAAGIPVLINSEWVEKTPLARAEWVKLVAALMNKESLVNEKFAEVEKEYERLVELAEKAKEKPSVITGMNSKDAWFVPSGDSYMVQFFKDAGASYHWENTDATGSLPLNFETVYPIALSADYWLNVGIMGVDGKSELVQKDVRYKDFKAFKTNKIYTYNKRINQQGSNDYWESGVVNPQVILADLIKILHPELLPDHQLVYYNPIR